MYSPTAFTISDPATILAFIRRHSFGLLVSQGEVGLEDTHTPFLVSEDLRVLSGHIARANSQWRSWPDRASVKVVFHGPHAYVSPRFYASDFHVPTWNYSAVSIDGRIEIIEDRDASLRIIENLVAEHEGPSGWRMDLRDERVGKLLDAVVCFSIAVENLQATFKLNQNKSTEDRESVIARLMASRDCGSRQTAKLMRLVADLR